MNSSGLVAAGSPDNKDEGGETEFCFGFESFFEINNLKSFE